MTNVLVLLTEPAAAAALFGQTDSGQLAVIDLEIANWQPADIYSFYCSDQDHSPASVDPAYLLFHYLFILCCICLHLHSLFYRSFSILFVLLLFASFFFVQAAILSLVSQN